jgi:hypothetical protein
VALYLLWAELSHRHSIWLTSSHSRTLAVVDYVNLDYSTLCAEQALYIRMATTPLNQMFHTRLHHTLRPGPMPFHPQCLSEEYKPHIYAFIMQQRDYGIFWSRTIQ